MTSVLDKVRRLAARRNRRARPRVPLLLALVALACGDDRAVDPPPPTPVASVAVGPERLTHAVGSSAALDAVALAADGAVRLPPEVLAALGLRPGGVVISLLEGDRLVVLSTEAAWRRVQALAAPYVRPSEKRASEELIEERRSGELWGD